MCLVASVDQPKMRLIYLLDSFIENKQIKNNVNEHFDATVFIVDTWFSYILLTKTGFILTTSSKKDDLLRPESNIYLLFCFHVNSSGLHMHIKQAEVNVRMNKHALTNIFSHFNITLHSLGLIRKIKSCRYTRILHVFFLRHSGHTCFDASSATKPPGICLCFFTWVTAILRQDLIFIILSFYVSIVLWQLFLITAVAAISFSTVYSTGSSNLCWTYGL